MKMVKAARPLNDNGRIYATVISPPPPRTTAVSVVAPSVAGTTTRRSSRPLQQQSGINAPFRPHPKQ